MISYDEILQNMRTAYFDECGLYPDMNTRVGVRLKAVASELCNLSAYTDYALKQSSWKTATGAYLDAIAAECSIERRSGAKANGTLTFSINEPIDNAVEIPQGTICCKSKKRFVQYETVEKGVILPGEVSCTVKARALANGEEYNAKGNEISIMVTPPNSVANVCNYEKFTGGYDDERDEVLRSRIKDRLKYPANGVNIDFERALIENLSTVHSCNIVFQNGNVLVYLRTYSGEITQQEISQVKEILGYYELMGQSISVCAATPREYVVNINYVGQANEKEIEQRTRDYCSSLRVGDMFSLSYLRDYLLYCGLDIDRLDIGLEAQGRANVNEYCVIDIKEVRRYE